MVISPLIAGLVLVGALAAGFWIRVFIASHKATSLEQKLRLQTEEAKTEAKRILLEAKDKAADALEHVKKEEKEREASLRKEEDRLRNREESLDRQNTTLQNKEEELTKALSGIESAKKELAEVRAQALTELERVAGLTKEAAKEAMFKELEREHRDDVVRAVQKFEKNKDTEVEKRALDIMTTALHRYARSHVAELTTTAFTLPNEDLKGKIIGREGRNIRTLERLTGVEVIVDEAPDTIVFSSFDPLRREIARVAMEKLIKDGRIQPSKIEEKVEEARQELTKRMQEIGEQAAMEVGVLDFPKEILQLLGRLHFRTSYGQNVLVHSVEMAHVASMLAAELGANIEIAKKGALVHDIGKAISHEVEGTHVELGRKILKKYGVDERVIQAMESHHEEYPFSSPEAFIVTAADVLSAARPGARRDTVENYIKRLEEMEKIVNTFQGVKNSYALSAGREVRVFVVPEKVDDFGALQMAKDIAAKIQSEMKYPGEIKVNVIREMRAVEYAR